MLEREASLEELKGESAVEFKKTVGEFNLNGSAIFKDATEQMKHMDHGPNHQEGDPLEHTQLVVMYANRHLDHTKTPISEEDRRVVRLAAVLHDIGKPADMQYDVVSVEQNKIVQAKDEEIAQAQIAVFDILSEITGQGTNGLSGKEMTKEIARLKGLIDKEKDDVLRQQRRTSLREKLITLHSVRPELKALVVNFRGHDKASKELADSIVEEAKIEMGEAEKQMLDFLIENHMQLFDLDQLNTDKFKKLFVTDGVVDEKKIALLTALVYGDNAGTFKKGSSAGSREQFFNDLLKKMEIVKSEVRVKLDKEAQDKKVDDVLAQAFPGKAPGKNGLAKIFSAQGKKGAEIGKATSAIKELVTKSLADGKSVDDIIKDIQLEVKK